MMRADELTVVIAFPDRDVPINYSNVDYDLHSDDSVTVLHADGRREHHGGLLVVDVQTYKRAAPAA